MTSECPRPEPQTNSARAPRLASFSTFTGRRRRCSISSAALTPTQPGRIDDEPTAPVDLLIGPGRPMPTPITPLRPTLASFSTSSTSSAAAFSPSSAEWSTSSSRQDSARTSWERSETATRRWEWPKSTPTARPAEGFRERRTGGLPPASPRATPVASACSVSRPAWIRSETMLDTVERDSPVTRAISALLAVPRPRSASMTRPRLSSRSDRSDPESADSTGAGTLTDSRGFVKSSEELPPNRGVNVLSQDKACWGSSSGAGSDPVLDVRSRSVRSTASAGGRRRGHDGRGGRRTVRRAALLPRGRLLRLSRGSSGGGSGGGPLALSRLLGGPSRLGRGLLLRLHACMVDRRRSAGSARDLHEGLGGGSVVPGQELTADHRQEDHREPDRQGAPEPARTETETGRKSRTRQAGRAKGARPGSARGCGQAARRDG